jgi:myosin heavy subunit
MTRRLEGLLDEQSRLEDATADLSQRTIGQEAADLSREELTELDRIAQRQRELRDLARQLVEDLRRRAEAMERVDPRAASGMRSAARTAEERQLDRDMETAADRARQNQLRTAQSSQQAANETMHRMLQDMQETQQARAEQLLRQLASLIQSIERLIVLQENELSALLIAVETGEFAGRDRAMIRLNQNTQAVAAEARAAGQQSRRIARALDRAADAQGAAVTALRSDPVRADAAREAEERSLELLHEAKRVAEELEQQTQEDAVRQRREALLDAYRALAERQIVLRARTLDLAGGEGAAERLDRRQLMEARRLGSQQDDIRSALEELERTTREVLDSPIFLHTHRMIARWSIDVTSSLNDGRVDRPVTDRQQMIAQAIGRLIEALQEATAPPPEFDEGQQEGGGGDGEQQLIPDIAQLRLLRGLQEEVYNQTRSLDGERGIDAAERADMLRELGRQQRDLMELGRDLLESLQQQP